MDPVFIFFKEIDFIDDNWFMLHFPHEEHIQEINFLENKDYCIISLNCNLVVKEHIERKKKFVEELSQKSRLLLQKRPAYQNDIAYVTLKSSYLIKKDLKTYRFEYRPDLLKLCGWPYKFYDVVDKKVKDCIIYSPFTHFINRGFVFNREFDRQKFLQINLNEDGKKLQILYNNNLWEVFKLGCEYYRDVNTIFTSVTSNKQ